MYEDMKSIQYWITAVNSDDRPNIDSKVPSSPDGIFAHPFNSFGHNAPCDLQDDYESCDGLEAHHMEYLSDSCSDDTAASSTVPENVWQAMAQQELLLDFFHEELRRIIPGTHNYNSSWLEGVDPDLVLSRSKVLKSCAGNQRSLIITSLALMFL
ncbi:hypothetical protein BDR07DRAFT_1376501 [Suillus spraguei]|nr:hypothetical protein BDR07DRAFT_1376501 [Suillus spraguei]